jgi:diguanylate cyclase (GGDEF)-like protein/PAS domain S-box-containing protein
MIWNSIPGQTKPRVSVASATLVFVAIVCLVVLGQEASRIYTQKEQAVAAGTTATMNLATSLTQHAELTFRAVDVAVAGLAERLETADDLTAHRPNLERWFKDEIERVPQIVGFATTDPAGRTVLGSEVAGVSRGVVESDAFRRHIERADTSLSIGPPIFDQRAARWVTPVSRRFSKPFANLSGVATAFLDLGFFHRFYKQFDIGQDGAILLMSGDNRLLVRRPFATADVGRDMTQSSIVQAVERAPVATVELKSTTDGVVRLNSYRRSAAYPIVISVAKSMDEILAPWRGRALRDIIETAVLMISIAIAGLLIGRMAHQRALATRRMDAAINAIPQGVCLFDAEQRLVVSNDRFREIYDYPPELLRTGTHLKEILESLAARGARQGDMTVQEYIDGIAKEGAETIFNMDGRLILINRRPTAEGGWVATHEDVTEQKHRERLLSARAEEIQLLNNRFRVAIDSLPQGLCVFDAHRRVVLFNENFREIYGYSTKILHQGASIRGMLDDLHARGIIKDIVPEELENLLPGQKRRTVAEVLDMTVSIQRTRTPDGGWVATYEDITEQQIAEQRRTLQAAELSHAKERLEITINNMPQGVCLFDVNQRIVFANARYGELYRLTPEQIKPGTSLAQILEHRRDSGLEFATAPDLYRNINIRKNLETQDLPDGRTISISRRLLSDGGWLTTHDDITARRRNERRIAHIASHDAMTGLANRTHFMNALDRATTSGGTNHIAVFLLDLDRFKAVNDRLGHAAGDELLKQVAKRLRAAVREEDLVARLGGDEFAIIQQLDGANHEGAISLARRIIARIAKPFDLDGQPADVGTSIGIALCPEQGLDGPDLLKKADLALYEVKSAGRNDFRIFDANMSQVVEDQRRLEEELRVAVEQGEFRLHYQPIRDARTNTICSAEALVRWYHPQRGVLSPDKFIPLAEETGLINPLGDWILSQACKDAASWSEPHKLAVNLSALQFKKGNLFDIVLCALVESGLSPERLELELTETALLDEQPDCLKTLRQLKSIGVTIVLDDFGTGYSSARYVTLYPFDKLKIDKSFVQGMATRRECAAVVASTIALARGLGIAITAEGVETPEQLRKLGADGIDFVQGYLIGYPVPLADFVTENWKLADRAVAQAS